MSTDATSQPAAISVCMPVYNGVRFLESAFACLAAQTRRDFEVIVVDDGSKDDSAALAESLLARHQLRGKVIRSKNQGCEQARDLCCDHASGPFLAPFDCDDYWLPEYLEQMTATLEANPEVGLVYCDFDEEFTATGQVVRKSRIVPWIDLSKARKDGSRYVFPSGVFFELLLQGQVLFPPCTLMRREAYKRAGAYSARLPQQRVSLDWDFGLRVSRVAAIAYLDNPLLRKVRHGTNTSGNVRFTAACDVAVLDQELADRTLTAKQRAHALHRASIRALDVGYSDWSSGGDRREARSWIKRSLRYKPTRRAVSLLAYTMIPASLTSLARRLKQRLRPQNAAAR